MASYSGSDKRLQFLFDMVSNFAQDYDNTRTYAVGAYTVYKGILYKCIAAITSAEDFDDTKWTQVLVMNEIGSGGGGGSTVTITPTLSSGTKIADFSINGVSDELYAPSGGGGGSSNDFPADSTPIVIGKYGTRDILRKRIYLSRVVTGSNAISDQLPIFDVLIGFHGYVKDNAASPRYMQINSDINTSSWYCGVLLYGNYNGSGLGHIWIGSPFNNGSAEIWIDYVAPIS